MKALWENRHPERAPVGNTVPGPAVAKPPSHVLRDAAVVLVGVACAVPEAKPRFLVQLPIRICPEKIAAVVAGKAKIL